MNLTADEKREIAQQARYELSRRYYKDYVEMVHHGAYQHFPHTRLICDELQRIADGEQRFLMIEMPPRHGKSMTVTESFPSYFIAKNPDKRVIAAAYSDSLARKFGRLNRNKLQEFGDVVFHNSISDEKSAANNWGIAGKRGGMIATGIGGSITGEGADLLIIDDPVKNNEEAQSPTMREKVYSEWESTLSTRLHKGASVIVVMTRWHEDDLIGRLLDKSPYEWTRLRLPAIAEDDDDLLNRNVGEALCPQLGFDEEWARMKKLEVGSKTWASLYQQRPAPTEGTIFKNEWWQFYEAPPYRIDEYVISWDLTFKDSETSDYVVGQCWGRVGADFYLIDQVRKQMSFTETVQAVRAFSNKHSMARTILVEDKANGPAVISTLQREISGIIPVNPEGGKVVRAQAVTPLIEAGNVWLPKNASWLSDLMDEVSTFPAGKHDDQCFVAGTLIATPKGNIPIEKLKIGDEVITPFGNRKITDWAMTGEKEVINKLGVVATKNHPVFTYEKGFINIDAITQALTNDKISLGGLISWRIQKLLFTMELSTQDQGRDLITSVGKEKKMERLLIKDCMLLFGKMLMDKKYLKATKFITSILTLTITTLKTWSVYQGKNIESYTRMRKHASKKKNKLNILKKLDRSQKHGTLVKKVLNGTKDIVKNHWVKLKQKNTLVNNAEKNSYRSIINHDSVRTTAILNGDINTKEKQLKENVSSVEKNLKPKSPIVKGQARKHVAGVVEESSIGNANVQKVYNITVDIDHCYYANGLLVSNCDAMTQALNRMANNRPAEFFSMNAW